MISSAGPNFCSWRHNSEPINPPAPVTSTRRPVTYAAIDVISVSTGRRPMTSSTSTSRNADSFSCEPLSCWLSGGSTMQPMPATAAMSETFRMSEASALLTATTTLVAERRSAAWARSSDIHHTPVPRAPGGCASPDRRQGNRQGGTASSGRTPSARPTPSRPSRRRRSGSAPRSSDGSSSRRSGS